MSTLKVDLDLRLDARPRPSIDPLSILLLTGLVLCTCGFVLVSGWLDGQVLEARAGLQRWDDKVAQVKTELPRLTQLKTENDQLLTQIQAVRGLSEDARHYSDMLRQLAALVPPSMWLSSIHIEPAQNSLTLAGTSIADQPLHSVAQLMNSMRSSYRDVSLNTATASRGADGKGFTFQVQAHYGPAEVKP